MTTQKPQENPTSTELLNKAQRALTPEQYARLEKRALEKVTVYELASMNLDKLKAELPNIVAGDPEEADIMDRLNREFPGIKSITEKPRIVAEKPEFMKHPMDYTKQKMSEAGDWMYENLVPERLKKAKDMSKEGASGKAIAATVLGGVAVGDAVQSAEKAISWIDRFRKDPIAWLKELFSVLFSFDVGKIKAFFSSTAESIGVTSSMAEKFAGILGIPEGIIKYAKKLFSLDIFGKMNYGDLSKVWEKFQKNPELNLIKELGLKEGSNTELAKVLGSIFGKNNKNILSQFTEKGGEGVDITKLSMTEVISRISS